MNHLAHAWLAGPDPGMRFGGLLGDFVHGQPDPALGATVVAGIRLHRAIDVYTDAHPELVAARARFEPPFRRYAGILLDMWFDHCLARDFARWSGQPLGPFSDQVIALLQAEDARLPPALRGLREYMRRHGLPAGYADPWEIGRALAGIGQRLSRANPLAEGLPALQALEQPLQAHFDAFMPDLRAFAIEWRGERELP